MQRHTFLRKSPFGNAQFSKVRFGKVAFATAALGGFLFFAAPPGAQAAGRDDCQRLIAKTEHELGEAIEDHGYNSRQANHWREERREAYERCYYGNGYSRDNNGYYRDENGYYRDQNGYYRDERGNYYYRYDGDRDRRYRDYDRERRRHRDWDDD